MSNEPPKGKQFRHVYVERGEPTSDAPRMRTRLGAVLSEHSYASDIAKAADRKFGVPTPYTSSRSWRQLLPDWPLEDVLSLVTVAFHAIQSALDAEENPFRKSMLFGAADDFLREAQEIFDEEHVHYQVDDEGGVHYKHDRAFDEQVAATIASLNAERYANARAEFERARIEMLKTIPDGKQALRSVFTSAEALFKQMFPNERRLTSSAAQRLSGPIGRLVGNDETAAAATTKALESFKDWVDAAHNYRHEQGQPEPVQPPLVLAQHLFSTGAAHVRWLAELDQANRAVP